MSNVTRLVLVGPVPPPVGGVSIHISRFVKIMEEQHPEFSVKVIDSVERAKKWGRLNSIGLLYDLVSARGDIYHIHKPDNRVLLWYYMLLLVMAGKKVVFTIHNERIGSDIQQKKISRFRLYSLRLIFRNLTHIICVNQRMARTLTKEGVSEKRISVIPAFIAPQKIEPAVLPGYVREFIARCDITILGYVFRIYTQDGVDVYGGDMMLKLMQGLRESYPGAGLIVVIPNRGRDNLRGIAKYEKIIDRYAIRDRVLICKEQIDMPALIAMCDLYIRPNSSDGDPLAVREALYLGTPTVASDASYKPSGTILHRNRDQHDFEMRVCSVIDNLEKERQKVAKLDKPEFWRSILNIYKAISHNEVNK